MMTGERSTTGWPELHAFQTTQLSQRTRPTANGGISTNKPREKAKKSITQCDCLWFASSPLRFILLSQSGEFKSIGSVLPVSQRRPTPKNLEGPCRTRLIAEQK